MIAQRPVPASTLADLSVVDTAAAVTASSVGILAVVIAVVRTVGPRAFSKMSSFDFAVTVSIGSILGSVATSSTAVINGALAIVVLLSVQAGVAWVRARRRGVEEVLDNRPILLMDGDQLLSENLERARMTADDVRAKLREADVSRLSDVRAVVLETTGDVSVITGHEIDPEILQGVRRGPDRDRRRKPTAEIDRAD